LLAEEQAEELIEVDVIQRLALRAQGMCRASIGDSCVTDVPEFHPGYKSYTYIALGLWVHCGVDYIPVGLLQTTAFTIRVGIQF
jgi:hypothetical protein